MVLKTQPKRQTPVHVQKRRGEHHRTTSRYVKTYWPYLPMALIIGLGIFAQIHWSSPSRVLGASSDVSAAVLLQQTNIQRSGHKEPALTLNDRLSQAAQAKAEDMAKRNYWSHVTPEGKQPWAFASQADYHYYRIGENLAYGFNGSSEAVAAWINSPKHRENLLGDYRDVGFGIANAPSYQGKDNQIVIVALYATPDHIVTGQSARTGIAPDLALPAAGSEQNTGSVLPARHVTRLETLAGANKWLAFALAAVSGIFATLVVARHGRLWRKAVKQGELLIIRHPVLDTIVVTIVVAGYLLTRTSGFIH